jgi:hypothetical protein
MLRPSERKEKAIMRRLTLLLTMMGATVLLAGGVALASQKPEILRFPIDETMVNPCNGESVHLTGTFQIVLHETQDASGGSHFIAEGNAKGIRGVGTSGTQYRATGGFWDEFNTNGRTEVSNSVSVFNIISKGPAPNFISEVNVKLTVNANGEVTAEFEHGNERCTG